MGTKPHVVTKSRIQKSGCDVHRCMCIISLKIEPDMKDISQECSGSMDKQARLMGHNVEIEFGEHDLEAIALLTDGTVNYIDKEDENGCIQKFATSVICGNGTLPDDITFMAEIEMEGGKKRWVKIPNLKILSSASGLEVNQSDYAKTILKGWINGKDKFEYIDAPKDATLDMLSASDVPFHLCAVVDLNSDNVSTDSDECDVLVPEWCNTENGATDATQAIVNQQPTQTEDGICFDGIDDHMDLLLEKRLEDFTIHLEYCNLNVGTNQMLFSAPGFYIYVLADGSLRIYNVDTGVDLVDGNGSITVSHDDAAGTMEVWLDGTSVYSGPDGIPYMSPNAIIGSYNFNTSFYAADFCLKNLQIFETALTEDEINANCGSDNC